MVKDFCGFWSDMRKSLERDSAMMLSVPLMCCEYRFFNLVFLATKELTNVVSIL